MGRHPGPLRTVDGARENCQGVFSYSSTHARSQGQHHHRVPTSSWLHVPAAPPPHEQLCSGAHAMPQSAAKGAAAGKTRQLGLIREALRTPLGSPHLHRKGACKAHGWKPEALSLSSLPVLPLPRVQTKDYLASPQPGQGNPKMQKARVSHPTKGGAQSAQTLKCGAYRRGEPSWRRDGGSYRDQHTFTFTNTPTFPLHCCLSPSFQQLLPPIPQGYREKQIESLMLTGPRDSTGDRHSPCT